jgi:hypothetical protein
MRPAAAAIEPSTTLWTNHSAITIMARSPVTFLGQCDSTISWVNEWLNGNTRNGITRPTMRFVAIKTEEQQATLMLHKTRDLLVRQRTMLINALRGHLTEYGIVSAQGTGGVRLAIEALHEDQESLTMLARFALHGLVSQLRNIEAEIEKIEAGRGGRGVLSKWRLRHHKRLPRRTFLITENSRREAPAAWTAVA